MCIKYAPYLQQKSANWALNTVFFDALVLMLLTKLVQNSTYKRCRSGIIFLNYDTKFAPNMMQELGQKGAGTKMHKCLVVTHLCICCLTHVLVLLQNSTQDAIENICI